jgi:hypothetical protein
MVPRIARLAGRRDIGSTLVAWRVLPFSFCDMLKYIHWRDVPYASYVHRVRPDHSFRSPTGSRLGTSTLKMTLWQDVDRRNRYAPFHSRGPGPLGLLVP